MGKLDHIYSRLPVWAQNLAFSSYGLYWRWLRFGAGFQEELQAYQDREKFTQNQWNEWLADRTQQLLVLAANQVPYYKNAWSEKEKKAALEGQLTELPVLEKDALRANPRQFLRSDFRYRRPLVFHTSGSTGTPIATYWTIREIRNSMALREARSARWAGVSFDLPRATFSGRLVVPDTNSQGPFYRYNAAERQVYFSAFHLQSNSAPQYVAALVDHSVKWLTGYAISWYLLARFILEQNLRVPELRAVITTSEKVTPEMKQVMEQAYGCPVFEEYSSIENAHFAHTCVNNRMHISPDAGWIEILRPDRSPCEPGEIGEVIVTGFIRTLQPLVRYRIGDLAMWDNEPCSCGRTLPVIKEVVGRIEEAVVSPNGRQIVQFYGIFVDQRAVREGQIIQEALDHIRVRIVPAGTLTVADYQDIIHRVQARLGKDVKVTVELVESIPRTASGKFPAVVSKINPTRDNPVFSLEQEEVE